MLNNTRNLHVVLDREALASLRRLSSHQLKRKHPGEHVAFTTPALARELERLEVFHEFHLIEVDHLQRCSFSPILGDEVALRYFLRSVQVLREQRWTRVFNLSNNPAAAHLIPLLNCPESYGASWSGNDLVCPQSPLKVLHLLRRWDLSFDLAETLLTRKALNQFDAAQAEERYRSLARLRLSVPRGDLRGVAAGVRTTGATDDDARSLEFLCQLFTVCALDNDTVSFLRSRGLSFEDWSSADEETTFSLDLIFTASVPEKDPWNRTISYAGKDPEDLTDLISTVLPNNFRKWTCLAFLFDYLGLPKLAYGCEQVIGRFDANTLQLALHQEVLSLKAVAKSLLDGIRQQKTDHAPSTDQLWGSAPTSASFVAAIELSLRPNLSTLSATGPELLAVKNRLRSLNAFYERCFRAGTLEIPTNDLALML